MARVKRLEPAGAPTWIHNNIIRRHEHLPIRLVAA